MLSLENDYTRFLKTQPPQSLVQQGQKLSDLFWEVQWLDMHIFSMLHLSCFRFWNSTPTNMCINLKVKVTHLASHPLPIGNKWTTFGKSQFIKTIHPIKEFPLRKFYIGMVFCEFSTHGEICGFGVGVWHAKRIQISHFPP